MANQLGTNPMTFTSTMATAYTANCRISNAVWSSQVTAGDELKIVDRNGNIIVDTKAQSANYQQALGGFGWVQGFQITVLGSGTVSLVVSKA